MRLDPAEVAPTPWANRLGATRELAVCRGADGEVDWRVSVADLDRDARFSTFPGIDRLFVALGPLSLLVDGQPREMATGGMARFAGEAAVEVRLERPTRALNVMTRRGVVRGEVRLRDRSLPAPADADLIVDLGARDADIFIVDVVLQRPAAVRP